MPAKRSAAARREVMGGLAKGLEVIRAFTREHATLTLSEVAEVAGLPAATARRCLHTLEDLGYVKRSGRAFVLRPKVLELGAAYLESMNIEALTKNYLEDLASQTGDSAALTVLDDTEIVYVARASVRTLLRLEAHVGSRLPAYPTSMGRVLLAFQPESAIDAYFERTPLRRLTEQTETNPAALRRILKEVRTKGYAAIQDELDYGIVSVALPIFGPHGRIVAAANCSDVTNRLDRDTMIKKRLPVLRQAVRRIEGMLTQHPELTNSVESVASDYVRSRGVARVGQPTPKVERSVSARAGRR